MTFHRLHRATPNRYVYVRAQSGLSMKPESVLKSIEREAKEKGLPIIGPYRGIFLDGVVKQYRPKQILEVGTLVGYSAIRMARLLPEGGLATCVELSPHFARIATSNVTRAGLDGKVHILVGDAKEILPELEGGFDMLFLDADKAEYLDYLMSCEPFLRSGSVVVADNVKSHSSELASYLRYVRNSGTFRSEYKEPKTDYRSGVRTAEPDAVEISVKL